MAHEYEGELSPSESFSANGGWVVAEGAARPLSAVRLADAAGALELWVPHDALAATPFSRNRNPSDSRGFERLESREIDTVLYWLAPAVRDDVRDDVRRLLAHRHDNDLSQQGDDAMLDELASLLSSERLWLVRRRRIAVNIARSTPQPAAPLSLVTPSMMRGRPSAAPAPAPVPIDPFASVDHDMQAAALIQAARLGLPFCEECEKARMARNAAGSVADAVEQAAQAAVEAQAVQAAQAAVFLLAAEHGVPFCEECERARQAQKEREAEMA